VRIDRVMRRDCCTEDQVRARMTFQLPQTEKVAHADFVIVHNEDDEDHCLMEQIQKINSALLFR
jgi:dephospho-CoA kinase